MGNDPKLRQQQLHSEKHQDSDEGKGAVEDDAPTKPGERSNSNESMSGQLGHRSQGKATDDLIDGADSDFPEPGENAEHSGELGGDPRGKK
jgi:hypothetical protein